MSTSEIDAARLLLDRLGVSPDDLLKRSREDLVVPTFDEYIPHVEAAMTPGTLRTYRPYLQRIRSQWPNRRLDEPTALELKQLVEHAREHAIVRRNSREGNSAAEHMASAIRCLYRWAGDDGYVSLKGNSVQIPRRARSLRTSLSDHQLAQINYIAATTGNDPDLDTLIIRLHIETACRRGGALALRPRDLDPDNCLIWLREKDQSDRWQPVSPTLMRALLQHCERGTDSEEQLFRYRNGRPITTRRYDYLWGRIGRYLSWVEAMQVSAHWLRHTTLTWVERRFGFAVAWAFSGHAEPPGIIWSTLTYVRASLPEVAAAVAALAGEPHPLAGDSGALIGQAEHLKPGRAIESPRTASSRRPGLNQSTSAATQPPDLRQLVNRRGEPSQSSGTT